MNDLFAIDFFQIPRNIEKLGEEVQNHKPIIFEAIYYMGQGVVQIEWRDPQYELWHLKNCPHHVFLGMADDALLTHVIYLIKCNAAIKFLSFNHAIEVLDIYGRHKPSCYLRHRKNDQNMIRNLVVSGGSTKTLAAIGCIRYLEEMRLLRDIICFVGTSAGSILCLMCCLGYSSAEMIAILEKQMITEKRGQLLFDELLDLNVLNSYGLDSGENMQKFIEQIVKEKLNRTSITFLELAKVTGKNLVICVANLSQQRQEYLDVDTHPTMDVVKAVRMSISLPIIFTPVMHNSDIYVDGGLYETLPLGYISRFKDPLRDTIAIHTRTVIDTTIQSFSDYISVLFSSVVDKANSGKTKSKKVNMMEIVFNDNASIPIDVQTLQFDITKRIIEESIETGYVAIKRRFEEQNS